MKHPEINGPRQANGFRQSSIGAAATPGEIPIPDRILPKARVNNNTAPPISAVGRCSSHEMLGWATLG
jgi:hypothetical protein